MSQRKLTESELRFLRETLKADYVPGNIRLREGEYQYDLAKAIASFQLEMYFPDVKEIIRRLYGEEKTDDVQFVRKIQTILKKMEKSDIVRILPKGTPWELQKYGLTSFKFEDSDKNRVVLGTDDEIRQSKNLLQEITLQEKPKTAPIRFLMKVFGLSTLIVASYAAIVWTLIQPTINASIFIPAFLLATICSVFLGRTLSNK